MLRSFSCRIEVLKKFIIQILKYEAYTCSATTIVFPVVELDVRNMSRSIQPSGSTVRCSLADARDKSMKSRRHSPGEREKDGQTHSFNE